MAINQKLVATQRVEELEFNREHSKLNPQLVALNKRPMRNTTSGGQQIQVGVQRTGEATKTVRYPIASGNSNTGVGCAGSGSTNGHGLNNNMSSRNSNQ